MKILKDSVNDFFKWVKGTELVELDNIDVSEDPVRPELTLGFRITHGRKIFGLKYENEIEAIVCVAFCPEVPYTVREMDYMSRVKEGHIAIAYTVWSRKRGAGKEIINKLREWCIKNWETKREDELIRKFYKDNEDDKTDTSEDDKTNNNYEEKN